MPSPPNPKRAAISQYWHSTGFTGTIARATLRTLQFITSIILLGIYGSDLSYFPSSTDINSPGRTNWIFAIVVALFSAVTCILHCFLTIKRLGWIFWDLVLCVLYAALSGTFGPTYLGAVEDADRRVTQSVQAMRAGVAFALMGMALWLVTVREARMVPYTPAHTLSLRMVPVYIQATESFHQLVRVMSLFFSSKTA
ncbi:hypothetical protein D6D18_07124 [Aureobasidium pullulans]|nr:hypothetical protein D6D18_07124 [Aureobasidium pullulans]